MMMVLWLDFAGKPELTTFFAHHPDRQYWVHLNSINARTPYISLVAICRRYIVVDPELLRDMSLDTHFDLRLCSQQQSFVCKTYCLSQSFAHEKSHKSITRSELLCIEALEVSRFARIEIPHLDIQRSRRAVGHFTA